MKNTLLTIGYDFLTLLFGEFLQNKDNSFSIQNKEENERLTKSLNRRIAKLEKNRLSSLETLKSRIKEEFEQDGLLITKKEVNLLAQKRFGYFQDNGLIGPDNKILLKK